MGIQTGTTAILYNPAAASWATRKWAIYLRQVQRDELEEFISVTTLKERDPALITQSIATRNVKSRVRRRYPGGPAISVPAGTRQVVVGPSIKLQAWPGRPVTLERPKAGGDFNPDDADVPMKVLQLTLDGSFPEFYKDMLILASLDYILRTNNGRPIFMKASATPTP
jgi:hypothetical protein